MGKNIIVNFVGTRGAGPVFALEMVRGLLSNNNNVTAIISRNMENYSEWEKLPIKKIVIKGYRSKLEYLIQSILFRYIYGKRIKSNIDGKYDFVYVPMIQMWTNKINSLFPDLKKVITVHDPIPHQTRGIVIKEYVYNKICENCIRTADKIVILSALFKPIIKQKYGFDDRKIAVIPHGRFKYYSQFSSESVENKDGMIHFLFFGRIEEYKGLELLANAFDKVNSKYEEDCDLRIVGSGDFSKYQEKYSDFRNVEIVNRWIKDEEVASFFLIPNTIVIIPYTSASQSGVISIANEFYCPVIATKVGGLIEQIEDEVTGILCDASAESLSEAMIDAIENYPKYKELAKRAKEGLSSLDWDVLADRLIGFVES